MDTTGVRIRWLGHAGFKIVIPDTSQSPPVDKVIYIDLWMQNAKLPEDMKDKVPDDADLILVTHGH